MDITMPGLNGVEATRQIVSANPEAKVVALSIHSGRRFVEDMLQAGAAGYMLKASMPEELVEGIRTVVRGEVYLSPSITGVVVSGYVEALSDDASQVGQATAVPVLATKLHRPPVAPDILVRARLVDLLNEGRGRPLTLVSAPAGYGKSTLASRWVAVCEFPSAWVALDTDDGDLRTFLSYVVAAIQTAFPEAGGRTRPALAAPRLPPVSALARFLLNDLDEIGEPFILVLDDYHRVTGTAVHDLLSELLAHPPDGMHLVLVTRRDPPLPISTLRARGQVTEVRVADLRFTSDETAAFLGQVLRTTVDTNTAAVLEEKTEGWVTGLRLAAMSLQNREDLGHMARGLRGDFHYIADYLVTEVVSRQTPAIASYMMEASLFDRFCASLCDAVHAGDSEPGRGEGSLKAQAFIDWLMKANLFVVPLDERRRWFRYHHLFQDLLRDQLERRYRPDDIAAIHARSSTWFEENGLIDEAIQHALSSGDQARAARLAEQNLLAVQDADQWPVAAKWLAMLPESVRERSPHLLMAQAWMLSHQHRTSRIPAVLDAVESLIGEATDLEPLRGEIDYYRGYFCYFQGKGACALEHLGRALERIPLTRSNIRGEAELIYGLIAQMEGREEGALGTLRGFLQGEQPAAGVRRTRLLAGLAFIHIISGRLREASGANQRLRDVCVSDSYPHSLVWTDYLDGLIAILRNDFGAAVRHLSVAAEGRYLLHYRASVDAMTGLVLAHQAMQRPDRADEALRLLDDYVSGLDDPSYLIGAGSASARLALLRGDLVSSTRWLRGNGVPDSEVMIWWLDIPGVTYCRALLAEGSGASLEQAESSLLEHLKANEANHNVRQMIDMLALLAAVHQKQGRDDEALRVVGRAVELAEPGGFIWPFIELGPPMAGLLGCLEREDLGSDFIGRILAAFPDTRGGTASGVYASENDPRAVDVRNPAAGLLSQRELDILPLLAEGLSNKEIARELHVATETVKTHLSSIYRKLNVDGRILALRRAEELRLLPRD